MAKTPPKTGNFEPMFLKIGIPVAISAASSICGIMMVKRSFPSFLNPFKLISKPMKNENFQSSPISSQEEETSQRNVEKKKMDKEGEKKELDKEGYRNLKEREDLLVEITNTLILDMAHANFLERGIWLMEEENNQFQNLVTEYLGVSEKLEGKRTDRLLEKEVKKLKKRLKDQSKIIREKNLNIEDSRTQYLKNIEVWERKKKMIERLGNEIKELQMQISHQLEEKKNPDLSTSKIEKENPVKVGDFNQFSNELNQLKDEFTEFRKQGQQGQKENPKKEETNSTRPKLFQMRGCGWEMKR